EIEERGAAPWFGQGGVLARAWRARSLPHAPSLTPGPDARVFHRQTPGRVPPRSHTARIGAWIEGRLRSWGRVVVRGPPRSRRLSHERFGQARADDGAARSSSSTSRRVAVLTSCSGSSGPKGRGGRTSRRTRAAPSSAGSRSGRAYACS